MSEKNSLPASATKTLLKALSQWGDTTTVVLHGGSVFEFKGPFPDGCMAEGHYNLQGGRPGFEGHLNLSLIHRVTFQDKTHRGAESYAFVFENAAAEPVFKVFVGRDKEGTLIASQVEAFKRIQSTLSI